MNKKVIMQLVIATLLSYLFFVFLSFDWVFIIHDTILRLAFLLGIVATYLFFKMVKAHKEMSDGNK